MMGKNYLHSDITEKAIRAFYLVYNNLGFGFLEKVYENAMVIELIKMGLFVKEQQPIKVFYEEKEIGFYIADIIINDCVILEIKAAEALCEEHEAQLLNYLKATEIEVGLLLNFGKKVELKRKVFSSEFKPIAIKNHEAS
jgi:GxxExxY protein